MVIPKGLRAVFFDFDGIIVDSEPLHFALFRRLLAEEGIDLTREAYDAHYLGMDDRECFTAVLEVHGKTAALPKVPELIERKSALLMSELNHRVPLLPGAADLVRALAGSVPLAVCSGALRREIEAMLRHADLLSAFVGIVSAEDVTHGKPDPQGYRAALALINRSLAPAEPIVPTSSLVIEDSIAGIEAARAAGMRCLAVANSYPAPALERARADAVVASLEGDPLKEIQSLFAGHWNPRGGKGEP